jgi:hypothetical protein
LIFKNHTEKMMEKRLKFARSYQTGPRWCAWTSPPSIASE